MPVDCGAAPVETPPLLLLPLLLVELPESLELPEPLEPLDPPWPD